MADAASRLPPWTTSDLPEPHPPTWRNWASFIGPGLVMMGIQIGGGEWLFGPEVTARYGGGLMWIASIAILLQVFYNLECGRYALYCGEPVFTGFMRLAPGPTFWMGAILALNASALIPGLSSHGAVIIASLYLGRPPLEADKELVTLLSYACLFGVALPVLVGGKVYNLLQAVMTIKVIFVLSFCLFIGVFFVSAQDWWNVFSGFAKVGTLPVTGAGGKEAAVNVFSHYAQYGEWPLISLANVAVLGAFAGYAGGGGLANSTYSNFVRDKGWGMGSRVGAIASAIGGRNITLSHVGEAFPVTEDNLRKWRGWWRYVLTDQFFIWAPGCFMGMALPALMSIRFAPYSGLQGTNLALSQAVMTTDGMRLAPDLGSTLPRVLWLMGLLAGLAVMLPSQMSIVDDFTRRWTDALWSGNRRIRETFRPDQVKWIYYAILGAYVLWSFVLAYVFGGAPKLMTTVIANLNNVAIGATSLLLLWVNLTLLPKPIRPRWYHSLGLIGCAVFYLGLSGLVFAKVWPDVLKAFSHS